jgi:hypothetical protein
MCFGHCRFGRSNFEISIEYKCPLRSIFDRSGHFAFEGLIERRRLSGGEMIPQAGGDILIDVDDDIEFFGGRIGHDL